MQVIINELNVKELPTHRSLSEIADNIAVDWKTCPAHAFQYVRAMATLDQITGLYKLDTSASIVRYFLANAGTWRGAKAREIKLELKGILKSLADTPRLQNIADQNHRRVYGAN